ncbi:hypothetical protein PHYSODRAFT_320844 [Phytophthora sojae]|uniref:Uncharacterized protein n=1 Tax=Phytophthora sojae (strain P6497) TaxID=1094619 RepID=G4YFK3_PHYSP|nr:hypothetical protein PHYSODRAFT_320844 [Phytophthora sojae]EGZ26988.1 hypothetical protein PHYSODRAFT_320844 [Phytophthora sojae]|eukprot:XP_009514263.1 hypothetical protein PHYSODRAFT_320844 [Phytophthora sojae]
MAITSGCLTSPSYSLYANGGTSFKFIEDDENDETKGSTPRNNNDEHTADMDYADSR